MAAAIESGPRRRIAVTLVQWAGVGEQRVVVPWTLVANDGSAEKFALMLSQTPRVVGPGSTSISSAGAARPVATTLVRGARSRMAPATSAAPIHPYLTR